MKKFIYFSFCSLSMVFFLSIEHNSTGNPLYKKFVCIEFYLFPFTRTANICIYPVRKCRVFLITKFTVCM